MLGITTPWQELVHKQLRTGQERPAARSYTLAGFADFVVIADEIEKMLLEFMDAGWLEWARQIKDVKVLKEEPDLLAADVDGFSIYMDYNGRFILHDC